MASADVGCQVLRESLDFPDDLAPAVAEGPDGTAVAVQTSAPGSKSEVGEGGGKKGLFTGNRQMTGK